MGDVIPFLRIQIFGNTVENYCYALLIFLGALILLRLLRANLLKRLHEVLGKKYPRFSAKIFDFIQENIVPVIYVIALYFALQRLNLNPGVAKFLNSIVIAVLTIQGIRLSLIVLMSLIERQLRETEARKQGGAVISKSVLTIFRSVIWVLGLVFLAENLGFNVSSILAGLGIGGIAVAMASQTILGDLFNYFVIFFDKPFREGDFIISGEYMGTIEHLGLKSTRIRSLSGEVIVVSNTNLTSSWIRNYQRMQERRIEFSFRLNHHAEQDDLKRITAVVKEAIQANPKTRFDRAHFKGVDEIGLIIEVVYFVLSPDYNLYMDIQHDINLKIRDYLLKEKMQFAAKNMVILEEDVSKPAPNLNPNPAK